MSSPRVFAVIPAAGMGKRMGASINKQYLQLGGMPIVARTLQIFQQHARIAGIMLVIPEDEIAYCRATVIDPFGLNKVLAVVPGGAERQHSVMNGLNALRDRAEDDDIVVIHDGVRPFISSTVLDQAVSLAEAGCGALTAVPAKDTIKVVQNGRVVETPDRATLWQAQTPQAFRYGQILEAHRQAAAEGFLGTDDCSLAERAGLVVRIVQGSYRNIKITTPEDLVLAEAFLKESDGGTSCRDASIS